MGGFTVDNCKRCDKVFRKLRREVCTECAELEDKHLKLLYNLLQESADSGGISIQALSEKTDIPKDEVFNYCFREDSSLGTARCFLKIACPKCESAVSMNQAKGYFCRNCGEEFMLACRGQRRETVSGLVLGAGAG